MSLSGDTGKLSVAIAGGGLIGLSIAWYLARRDVEVTIFEHGKIGSEASWAGAGMLAPGGEVDELSLFGRLAIDSRALYADFVHELERETGLPIDFQECGALELAYTPEEWRALESRAALQREIGIRNKPVNTSQIPTFWPRLRKEDLAGAFFYPGDAIVNPRELVAALEAACRKRGMRIVQNCDVRSVEVNGNEAIVQTSQATEPFCAFVVAAGAWSSSIAVHGAPALPRAYPVRGHLVGYHQPEQTCSTIVRHQHLYLLQRANGLLIAGATLEEVGFSRELDSVAAVSLAERAGWLIPHLAETTPTEIWNGLRPGSEALRLGSWHSKRLYLAYGHYRNGILLAPVTGRDLAKEIVASQSFRAGTV